ncbi:hypothetical protein H0B56_05060 [Haloechinothrix sp. YIM 98757]|uniref:Peptide chain release factor 1 (ERF1) n=1 Tax=Haloechinothrix aidingensis TaxID=2752311 RepID=A0A837ZW74_9PSEU|nr:Vms1/Ankzf1 family peptidyl-tRNA hydrolase [Haloechinothrix aidingensis]MBA0124906.1 hypothetical protein [Haloechinothrix aidingensis]
MKLAFLQDVYRHDGPFATVYLDTSAGSEDAAKAMELRWRSARERLSRQGADERTLDALESNIALHGTRPGCRGRVLVASGGAVVFHDELDEPPEQFADDAGVAFEQVPQLMPYLRMRRTRIPHALAMVDRIGADITVVDSLGHAGHVTVEGDDDPHHKSHAAGEGDEKHHHQRVEERWKANAGRIAEELTRQVREHAAEVIVLGGDVEQRKLVQDRLRKGVRELVIETGASHRGRHAVDESLHREVGEAVATALRSRVEEAVGEFERARGNRAHATEGWKGTVDALLHDQVSTLLWSRDTGDSGADGVLAIGPEPNQVATDETTLTALGAAWVAHVPAQEAILRAAACTRADLVLVEEGTVELDDGLGALLRFTTTPE